VKPDSAVPEGARIVEPQKAIEGVVPGLMSPPMPAPMVDWNDLTREKLAGG
jgi:hypothetical protein